MSFLLLSIAIISAVFIIINWIAKPLMVEEKNLLIEQYGNSLVSDLSRRTDLFEGLCASLSNTSEKIKIDSTEFKTIIKHILDLEGYEHLIVGGGVWPAPFLFDNDKEKRSFFWGRDTSGVLKYYPDYNNKDAIPYYLEEWYVPAQFLEAHQAFWSKSYMDPYSYQPMVTCTTPIIKEETFWGVSTIDIKLEGLNNFLQSRIKKTGGYAFALDRNNKFLCFPNEKLVKNYYPDQHGKIVQEFIYTNELSVKNKSFTPLALFFDKLNKQLISKHKEQSKKLFNAARISSLSNQISLEEAELIQASILDQSNRLSSSTYKLEHFVLEDDILLNESVIVNVFYMPSTFWKIVMVIPFDSSLSLINLISKRLIIIFTLILTFLLTITFLLFRYKLLTPLHRLSLQLHKIAKPKNEDNFRLEYRGDNEIGELVHWLNTRNEELRHSEDLHRKIFNGITEAIFIQGLDGRILEVNNSSSDLYGYTTTEMCSFNIEELSSGIPPYTMNFALEKIKLAKSGKTQVFEWQAKRKDGILFWIEVSLKRTKLRNEDRLLAVIRDIDLRKNAEDKIHRLNEELEKKVEIRTKDLENAYHELNEFAHIVSHDLKAPLRGISQLANWLQTDLTGLKEEHKKTLDLLINRVHKMYALIDGILHYSRISSQEDNNKDVNINLLIQDIALMLNIPDSIELRIKNILPTIFIDPTKIQQVFQNLIANSVKFMDKENGLIEISSTEKGSSWEFTVADNGPGIAPQDLKDIFKIFQSIKINHIETSTGIGLSIVKKIVESYNGKIQVTSELKIGTSFSFSIQKKLK